MSASTTADDSDCCGAYDVVWWDPFKLTLGVPRKHGIRQYGLLEEAGDEAIEEDLKRYQEWCGRREATVARASVPSLLVQTATERARQVDDGNTEPYRVSVIEVACDLQRPAGLRYGALVHAVLASVPLDAGREEVNAVATLQGRILGATPDEVASAASVVEATLQHPVMLRARRASKISQCRREAPITLKTSDGTVVDGVVDIAFLDEGEWTIVDFKTDRELEHRLHNYVRQVSLYARAIALATEQNVSAFLMRV
jgi:ATP-dependent exoDNAse (exonuclease V) beta subunit